MQLDGKSVTPILAILCLGSAAVLATLYGWGASILLLAGAALVGAIGLFWRSLQGLAGEAELTLHEALELAAPTAEEEQKVAVLRALKDLEYERSVGKISEEDYTELSRHYRHQAKQLLRHLDKELEPARKQAERELEEHLNRLKSKEEASNKRDRVGSSRADGNSGKEQADDTESGAPDADQTAAKPDEAGNEGGEAEETHAKTVERSCDACGTKNDADASFCKKCGAKMVQEVGA